MAQSSKGGAASKPEQPARPVSAKAPAGRASTRAPRKEPLRAAQVTTAPEALPAAEPPPAEAAPSPALPEPAAPALEAVVAEALAEVADNVLASAAGGAETLVDAASEAAADAGDEAVAAASTVLQEVDRLRGVTLAFWQDHLQRTMAAGQAILASPSPQAAMAVQASYLQASLASGIAHAGSLARLSSAIARNIGPLRGR